jgi:L-asparaginase
MEDGRVHVGLVLTGGTIGPSKSDGMVVIDLNDRSFAETALVEKAWIGPGRLQVHTRAPVRKLSEDMNQHDWLAIAEAIREQVEDEGLKDILVFHGTDTASYTAAALSFLLADVQATVIITGSNVPANEPNSDALTNVRHALLAARMLSPGVYLSFAGTPGASSEVHLGSAVRKEIAEGLAYESPNLGPVAIVTDDEVEILRSWPRFVSKQRPMAVDDRVTTVYLHPGIDLDMYADAIIGTDKKGVIVRLYASATGPQNVGHDSLTRFVNRCEEAGVVVIACLERFVGAESTYPSLVAVQKAGALFAADMIPEVAFVKLCWALAQGNTKIEVQELFLTPISGESLEAARITEEQSNAG